MPLALIPVLIQLGMQILGWIINKKLNDDKLKKAFAEFSELARTENIRTIIKRQGAESQIESGNAKWDKEELASTDHEAQPIKLPPGLQVDLSKLKDEKK